MKEFPRVLLKQLDLKKKILLSASQWEKVSQLSLNNVTADIKVSTASKEKQNRALWTSDKARKQIVLIDFIFQEQIIRTNFKDLMRTLKGRVIIYIQTFPKERKIYF